MGDREMTNGEKLKEIFPNIEIVAIVPNEIVVTKKLDGDGEYTRNSFRYEWWNAEYKEPTTKNDLGVDCIVDVLSSYTDLDIPYKREIAENILKNLPSVTPQEPRWIPVSERLPEERLGVLVWCPTRKNIYCACYEEEQWCIFGAYREKVTEEIVAWRPLPTKPYREVEE